VSLAGNDPVLSTNWNCWGLVAAAYYVLEGSLLSGTRLRLLSPYFLQNSVLELRWIATTIGGFLVGLTHLMGLPGEVALVVDRYMIQVEFLCAKPQR